MGASMKNRRFSCEFRLFQKRSVTPAPFAPIGRSEDVEHLGDPDGPGVVGTQCLEQNLVRQLELGPSLVDLPGLGEYLTDQSVGDAIRGPP